MDIRLRPMTMQDREWLTAKEPDLSEWLTEKQCKCWGVDSRRRQRRFFVLEDEKGKIIGYVGIVDVLPRRGCGELRVQIWSSADRGKGHGTKAISEFVGYLFSQTSLRSLYLRVSTDNIAAIRCYHKCGFKKVGLLRVARDRNYLGPDRYLMVLEKASDGTT